MTVQNVIVKNIADGNGVNKLWPFTFACPVDHPEFVKVFIKGVDGNTVQTNDYTVDMQTKYVTYPVAGKVLETGERIIIARELPLHQILNLVNQGPFFAEDLEVTYDELVMMIQQLNEQLGRSLKVGIDIDQEKEIDITIPVPTDDGNHGLRITKNGFEIVNDPSEVYDDTVAEHKKAVEDVTALKDETEAAKIEAENAAKLSQAWAEEDKETEPSLIDGAKSSKQWAELAGHYAEVVDGNFPYVTPEMFGAKGNANYPVGGGWYVDVAHTRPCTHYDIKTSIWYEDGAYTIPANYYVSPTYYEDEEHTIIANDDTVALQAALDSGKPVMAKGNYLTSGTLNISGWGAKHNLESAIIRYTGTDNAIYITRCKDSVIRLGEIYAPQAEHCVKIYSAERNDYVQYLDIYFKVMECKHSCVYISTAATSWCNEIRINEGRFQRGLIGLYIDTDHIGTYGVCGAIKLHKVGFEGVTNGCYINSPNDWSTGYTFYDCRYAEIVSTEGYLIKTVGSVEGIMFIGTSYIRDGYLDLSQETFNSLFFATFRVGDGVYYPAALYSRGRYTYLFTSYTNEYRTNIDLNTLTVDGVYRFVVGVTNAPQYTSAYGSMVITRRGDHIIQEFTGDIANETYQYGRAYRISKDTGATWSEWYYIEANRFRQTLDSNYNLNNIIRHGAYRVYAATNTPTKCSNGGILEVTAVTSSNIKQEYTAPNGNEGYWRAFRFSTNNGSSWTNWRYVATSET